MLAKIANVQHNRIVDVILTQDAIATQTAFLAAQMEVATADANPHSSQNLGKVERDLMRDSSGIRSRPLSNR